MTTTKLPTHSFVALAAVAWADGRMSASEAAGLLHAAKTLGLEGDDYAGLERATREKIGLDAFDPSGLSSWERLLTYGLATWLSRIDGMTQAAELESLKALASALISPEITPFKLQHAASAAFDVAMQPEGRRPDRYDFKTFEASLRTRLPTVK
jgi:uncharacterized tellurite resistance protein B-like protein